MDKIIDLLKKIEHGEDQALVGLVRAYGNLKLAKAILEATRGQDLGATTNQVVDELIVIVDKALLLTGDRTSPATTQ